MESPGELSRRRGRPIALIAIAITVVTAASLAYLQSNRPSQATSTPPSASPRATLDQITYDFVDPSLGWAVENLNTPTNSAGGFAVFRTTDGARHWQRQLSLERSFIGYLQFSVQFLDHSHGFIGVGNPFRQLERTTNGGASWDSFPLPAGSERVDSVAFSTPSHGWLLVGYVRPILYVTSDAGNSWQRLPDPPADVARLTVRGPSEAWMGTGFVGPTPPHVYESTDGCQTWRRLELPPPGSSSWSAGHNFIPAGIDLLPGRGVVAFIPPVDESELMTFSSSLVSFDEGATWRYLPPLPGTTAYQDATHWWAMNGTSIFKSSDAGQTWTTVTRALPDWQFIPHVLDSKHAWAETVIVGGFGLAMTDDGGLHWREASVPPPS